jgi:MoaA/NifB/PqqE/SkfB family radical SAM enzyme
LGYFRRPVHVDYCHTVLQVEPTLNCNMKCNFCTNQHQSTHGDLKLQDLEKIVQRFPYLTQLNLTGVGEPFMNPDILPIINHIKSKGIYLRMTTNAMLLNEDVATKLIDSGLDELKVSFDAIDPLLANTLRRGSKIDRIIRNIEGLNRLKAQRGSKTPYLEINTVLSTQNVAELPKIIRVAAQLKARGVYVFNILNIVDDPVADELALYRENNRASTAEVLEESKLLAARLGLSLRLPATKPTAMPCNLPWALMLVAANGDLYPCCIYHFQREHPDARAEGVFGNILADDRNAVVNSPTALAFRDSLRNGHHTEICARCPASRGLF